MVYVYIEVNKYSSKYNNITNLSILLAILTFYFFHAKDFRHIHHRVNAFKSSYRELKNVQHVLNTLSENGKCYLITESTHIPGIGFNHTAQKYRPLDYFWVISDCVILNGSWLTSPLENSRDLFGLPSQSFFRSTTFEPIYFLGTEGAFSRYIEKLQKISAQKQDIQIGGNTIYKMIRK